MKKYFFIFAFGFNLILFGQDEYYQPTLEMTLPTLVYPCGTNLGTATAGTVSNAVGALSYRWYYYNTGQIISGLSGLSAVDLPVGAYILTIDDGCQYAQANFEMTSAEQTPTPTSEIISQPTCQTPTGTILIAGLSGTWNLTWNTYNMSGTTSTQTISNLVPGTYSFTSTTEGKCPSEPTSVLVINPAPSFDYELWKNR
jgi:hypothetical protein